jgi:hypothetical protein
MSTAFSNFIVYVDESGDHGPVSSEFPLFVLAFCIFKKNDYANTVMSDMHLFKFKYFGHDTVVMHERDIRMSSGPFSFLMNKARRETFMADLSTLIEKAPVQIVAAVIDKAKLRSYHANPPNPYHLAMKFGLERIQKHRNNVNDTGRLHVAFARRGEKEVKDLEFRRVCDANATKTKLDFEPLFTSKETNHCGLQLADLVARPSGRHRMNPGQLNCAYSVRQQRLRRLPEGKGRRMGASVLSVMPRLRGRGPQKKNAPGHSEAQCRPSILSPWIEGAPRHPNRQARREKPRRCEVCWPLIGRPCA